MCPNSSARPYTETNLEPGRGGQKIDVGYLVYKDIKIPLNQTEYAVATSLLRPGGLQKLFASSVRRELFHQPQILQVNEIIDQSSISNALSTLRKKITASFGDLLVLPQVTSGGAVERTKGLRFWTKEELYTLRQKMRKPGPNIVTLLDERAQWHLYIDGKEIKPRNRAGVSDLQRLIVSMAASREGFDAARLEITVSATTLQQAMVDLRRILEKEVGMTLTKRVGGNNIKQEPVRLVRYSSGKEPNTRRKEPS